MIEPEPRLLAQQEPFVGALMAEQFEQRGIRVLVGTGVESVSRPAVQDTGVGRIHGGPATITAGGSSARGRRDRRGGRPHPGHATTSASSGWASTSAIRGGYLQTDDHMAVAGRRRLAVRDR